MIRMHESYLDQGLLVRMPSFSMPRGYFYIFIVSSGHICPHALRQLPWNFPWRWGLQHLQTWWYRRMSVTWTRGSWWWCNLSVCQWDTVFSYFYCCLWPHLATCRERWLRRNMPRQLGLTAFSDLMIRMHECYLDQGLLVRMPSVSISRGIFLYFDCRCWPHLPTCREVVTKKYAVTIRVNNIFRPDDPHARVLPWPGSWPRGYFYIFIVASGHIWPHAVRGGYKEICPDS